MADAQRLSVKWTKGSSLDWFLLIVLAVIWGSSYVLIKKSIQTYEPVQVAQLRMILSGVFLLPFLPRVFKRVPRSKLLTIIVVGVVGSAIPAFLYPFAQQKIDSAVMGIINSTVPLFTFSIGVVFFHVVFNKVKALGILIGLSGALVLVFLKSDGSFSSDFGYALIGLAATLCYGLSTNLIKSKLNEVDPLALTSAIYIITGFICLISALPWTNIIVEQSVSEPIGFLYISLLALFGTAIAMILFNRLVQRTDALFAATVTYLMPLVSIFWGVLDGESLGLLSFLGMILILLGVFVTNRLGYQNQPSKKNGNLE